MVGDLLRLETLLECKKVGVGCVWNGNHAQQF